MENLEPKNRLEQWYQAMIDAANGDQTELFPTQYPQELWFEKIIDAIKSISSGGGSTGGGVLVVHSNNDILDHTVQEIFDAPFAVLDRSNEPDEIKSLSILAGVTIIEGEEYSCTFNQGTAQFYYIAASADDYPQMQIS